MEAKGTHDEATAMESPHYCLRHDEQCPLCSGNNQCRVAKGELYKGACWCQEILVPNHILSRLAAARIEHACLCRPCLETIARLSGELDDAGAVLAEARRVTSQNPDHYLDGRGNVVFTASYHLKRGTCCTNNCRHCPY